MLKIVRSTVAKKDLMILLPYLGKRSLQIRTKNNCAMKNKLPYCNLRISLETFHSHSKMNFLSSYVLALFIPLSVVAAMLPIM